MPPPSNKPLVLVFRLPRVVHAKQTPGKENALGRSPVKAFLRFLRIDALGGRFRLLTACRFYRRKLSAKRRVERNAT
jgi:hypothetical protein